MAVRGKRLGEELQRADCEVMIAARSGSACQRRSRGDSATLTNGGMAMGPARRRAEAIEMSARILTVAHQAEIHFRIWWTPGARATIQRGAVDGSTLRSLGHC